MHLTSKKFFGEFCKQNFLKVKVVLHMYDQKVKTFSDLESVFASHLPGKSLSFDFYPNAVYFECKVSLSAVSHVQNSWTGPQRVGSGKK